MSHYKHGNGRVQLRGRGGKFRRTTLQDFGIPQSQINDGERTCNNCGHHWRPILVSGICPKCKAQDSRSAK